MDTLDPLTQQEGSDAGDAAGAMELQPGDVVDHFRVMRLLGRGGMGQVYLARDVQLGRKVALKLLHPQLFDSPRAVARMLAEARITAHFNHPHIVSIYAVGQHRGVPYMALEYMEGETLHQRMLREQLGTRESMRLGLAIAEALIEAHGSNVLHRDLKPGNVYIGRDGRLRVLDFGLAKFATTAGVAADRTQPPLQALPSVQGLKGSPQYMAPEQWQEQDCTPATDIWALGTMLHELLGGARPFPQTNIIQLAMAVTSSEPVPELDNEHLDPELTALVTACLSKDPALRPGAEAVATRLRGLLFGAGQRAREQCPFPGLLPYSGQYQQFFFGRETEIAALVEQLRQAAVCPVVGCSGAGKSSFVQAGVIPRLQEDHAWCVLKLRPGHAPFRALAARLGAAWRDESSVAQQDPDPTIPSERWSAAAAGTPDGARPPGSAAPQLPSESELARQLAHEPLLLSVWLHRLAERHRRKVLLFVDQLEELFTLVEQTQTQQRFLDALLSAAEDPSEPVRVIFTLRDDFLGRLPPGPGLRRALGQMTVISPPGAGELRQILLQPLTAVGYSHDDPALVQRFIDAVQGQPVALPLLSFTMRQLWERRDRKRRVLRRLDYQAMGGVQGALARHARGVLDGLSPAEVDLTRQLLLRMVTPERTRKAQTRERLLAGLPPQAAGVLERLVEARLVSVRKGQSDRDQAEHELAHESLMLRWQQLRRWINESHEDLHFLAEVGQAADLWERRGRHSQEVWRGKALHDAVGRSRRQSKALPPVVEQFLDAGQSHQQRRRRRRRLLLGAGVGVLALLVLVEALVAVAYRQRKQQAEQARIKADRARIQAETQRARAQLEGAREAMTSGSMLEARAKLRGSLQTRDSTEGRLLWWRLRRQPLRWRLRRGGPFFDVVFTPDGRRLAAVGQDQSVYLLDVQTRRMRVLRGHTDQLFAVDISPDGGRLASAGWGGQLRLWDLRTGASRVLHRSGGAIWTLAFSTDGRRLVWGGKDRVVRIYDVVGGKLEPALAGHKATISTLSFCGKHQLASVSRDGEVRLWDLRSGQGKLLGGNGRTLFAAACSPDGSRLATGGEERVVRLWDTASGAVVRRWSSAATVVDATFGPRGRTLALGDEEGLVRIFEMPGGSERRRFVAHRGPVDSLAFDAGGRLLASSSRDKSVALWDLDAPHTRREADAAHQDTVYSVAFAPNDGTLVSCGMDHTIRIWDVPSGALRRVLRQHRSGVFSLAVTPTPRGWLLAAGSMDRTLRLWRMPSAEPLRTLLGHTEAIIRVSFDPSGERLASGSRDRTVRLWDVASGRQRRLLRGHADMVQDVVFSPDGKQLASASRDRKLLLWDLRTGRGRELGRHAGAVRALAFSADGRLLASAGEDHEVRLWELPGLRGRVLARRVPGRIYTLDFSPDGKTLAGACSDGTARLWPVGGGAPRLLRGHGSEVNSVRHSHDGKLLATTSDDYTVRLWEAHSGRPHWRALLILPPLRGGPTDPPVVLTHQGWMPSGGQRPLPRPPGNWAAALEQARQASLTPNGKLLCLLTREGTLQLWDLARDARLAERPAGGASPRLVAANGGCLVLAGRQQQLWHHTAANKKLLLSGVAVLSAGGGRVLAATARQIFELPGGAPRKLAPARPGIASMLLTKRWLVLGFRDGNIELLPRSAGGARSSSSSFEDVPASPVVSLLQGPRGTLVAGYAGGLLGIWNMDNGDRLVHVQLHGPVEHLLRHNGRLHAATALGDRVVLDLSLLQMNHCELLRQVWRGVPVQWQEGLVQRRSPPADHRCLKRAGAGNVPKNGKK